MHPLEVTEPARRRIAEVLADVLGREVALDRVEALAGISNHAYRVRAEGGDYVVKLRRSLPGAVLDVAAEAALTRTVAAAGLAPALVGEHPERGALVTEYHAAATPWTTELAREPGNLGRIAARLRELHALSVPLRAFECAAAAERYIEAAGVGSSERARAAELRSLCAEFAARYAPTALCHNDLIADNILDDAGTLLLIDFEYAMCADPVLDLASFAFMNGLGVAEREGLIEAYYHDAAARPSGRDFARVVRLVELVAYFWAQAAARAVGDASPFAAYLASGGCIDRGTADDDDRQERRK